MRITFYAADDHACGLIRGEIPARVINSKYPNVEMVCKRTFSESDIPKTNVAIFQRTHDLDGLLHARKCSDKGIPVLWDMDDDLFNIPSEFELPYKYFSRQDVQNGLVAFMTNSDAIIASTMGLAQQLGSVMSAHTKEDKRIYIIENGIDVGWWSDAREVRAKNRMHASDVVIGWFGSGSHKGEMRLIREAAANILRSNPNVKFSFVGLFDWKDFGDEYNDVRDRVTMINWLSYERLKNWMCHIDIGLAPIADIPFNLGKSAIKWLQYGAMEVPCIASNVGPYKTAKNAENIILCSNTTQEWTDAMLDLVKDVQKRREIGRNSFLEASSRWSDYDHAAKIVAVCEAAMKEKRK